jgi:peptidoglycan/LPS O-acetylase OafA/YrhL
MITTQHPTDHEPVVRSNQPNTRRLVRSGSLAGAIAAVCTTVVAAVARAADVSLEITAEAIPIPAFAWWTIIGAALGVVLARLLRERRRFVVVATVAAGLSLIPPIAAPDDTATTAVLVGAHLLAAAIIISTLSQRLTAVNNDRSSRPAQTGVAM